MAENLGWTFHDGKKYPVGGSHARGVNPKKVKESISSNGLTKYVTILWNDGVLSCDCRGWAILKKDKQNKPKPRDCKHCKAARDSDYADMTAVGEFVPSDTINLRRPQIDFSNERQFRNIRIRDRAET